MRELLIIARQTALPLSYTKPTEPLDVFWSEVSMPASGPPRERQRTEPFSESQPAWSYAEFKRGF